MTRLLSAALVFASLTGAAYADHDHHGPPPQALDACKAKASGDACSVTWNDKTMDGTCKPTRDDASVFACHPAHPPGPPPAAIDACKGKADNDACTVTWGDHAMNGTCTDKGHDGEATTLHCRPAHPHH